MNKTIISIFLNIILIGGIIYFFITKDNITENPIDTKMIQINEKNETKKLESNSLENLITMDDIQIMQEIGVLVSFEEDKEAYKIPSDMTPSKLLEANYLSFNKVELFVLPNWLSKMHNLLWLDLTGTKVTSKELQKLQGLKKLKFLNIGKQERIDTDKINLPSVLIGQNLQRIKFSFDDEKKSHLTSLDITQKRLLEAKHINFNGTTILHLPNWFEKMDNLVRLDFNSVGLTLQQLKKLSSLKHLKILDLTNNDIFSEYSYDSIANILKNLPLTELTLENTKGKTDNYKDIEDISTLVKLNLSRNTISDLKSLHLEKLINLKSLNLSQNKLSDDFNSAHLPKKSLVKLDLALNNIAVFLFTGDFPQLEFLDISNLNISDNKRKLSFDDKYGGAFILNKIKQVKVNNDVRLPNGLWKKLTKDILPEIIAYGKKTTIIIDGLEYRNSLIIDDINGTKWRLPTKEEVDKLKIANPLRNSKGKEFYIRKEFIENLPKKFCGFIFKDMKIGNSFFDRRNAPNIVRFVRTIKINWLKNPKFNICKANEGKVNDDGTCSANWNNAIKICNDMGGVLPSYNILNQIVKECGNDAQCYKERKFFHIYWTKNAYINNINRAWYTRYESLDITDKSKKNHVRCVENSKP